MSEKKILENCGCGCRTHRCVAITDDSRIFSIFIECPHWSEKKILENCDCGCSTLQYAYIQGDNCIYSISIGCPHCGRSTPEQKTEKEAVEAWNRALRKGALRKEDKANKMDKAEALEIIDCVAAVLWFKGETGFSSVLRECHQTLADPDS